MPGVHTRDFTDAVAAAAHDPARMMFMPSTYTACNSQFIELRGWQYSRKPLYGDWANVGLNVG